MKMKLCKNKITSATNLVSSLGMEERKNWNFQWKVASVVEDVLLVSAFVPYIGPFIRQFW
jgi:hypothetical protein